MPTDTSGRVTMGVEDVDHLGDLHDRASHMLDSLEAKHIAGGGTTDISQEVQCLRDLHDATSSVVGAARSARAKAQEKNPDQGQMSVADRQEALDEANQKNAHDH